jgi:hypothetical protein
MLDILFITQYIYVTQYDEYKGDILNDPRYQSF